MAKELLTNQDLINWCDKQVEEGHELSLHWEGGGDSGWVYFKIDDDEISESADNSFTEKLISLMYDQLDYGSWAGEFSASGQAVYDAKLKAFVGIDYYGEDNSEVYDYPIKIKIPENLWFDAVNIHIESENEGDTNVEIAFSVRNGFLTDEHEVIAEKISTQVVKHIDKAIINFQDNPENNTFRSIWQEERFNRNELMIISQISMGTSVTEEKDVYLELKSDNNE
jgi:hypothetical protein